MDKNYMEYMVRKKRSPLFLWGGYLCIFFAIVFLLFGITRSSLSLIFFVVFAVSAYFLKTRAIIEFEYLYLEKEITIDKVIGLKKRKNVAKIKMENVDLFAPLNSDRAKDALVYAKGKEIDYSTGDNQTRENCYVIITGNGQKYIIEPKVEFVKMAQMTASRKVFIK
jgi:hypothetical protein